MTDAEKILRTTRTVLVIDWPSRDVPDTLARGGFVVTVRDGPGPADYSAYESTDDEVGITHLGVAPEHADLLYVHRPVPELPGIVAMAQSLGAKTVWLQSGLSSDGSKDPTGCWLPEQESRKARELAEAAGLSYVDGPYIADAVRRLTGRG